MSFLGAGHLDWKIFSGKVEGPEFSRVQPDKLSYLKSWDNLLTLPKLLFGASLPEFRPQKDPISEGNLFWEA